MVGDQVSEVRSGMEQIYPGSHELRPIALVRVESPLVPGGVLLIAAIGKPEELQSLGSARAPEKTAELLSAVAASISGLVKQSTTVLATPDRRSFPEPQST